MKGEFPISVNGVTIGSDFDEIYEKLGFVPGEYGVPDPDSDGVFSLLGRAENYTVVIKGKHMKVKRISICYNEKNNGD